MAEKVPMNTVPIQTSEFLSFSFSTYSISSDDLWSHPLPMYKLCWTLVSYKKVPSVQID